MLATKRALQAQYEKGWIKDLAHYSLNPWNAIVLVEWDDEQVFGYYQYSDQKKEFFRVKLHQSSTTKFNRTYFRLHNLNYDLENFMRIR